jgi:GTPase SAR1 family protein
VRYLCEFRSWCKSIQRYPPARTDMCDDMDEHAVSKKVKIFNTRKLHDSPLGQTLPATELWNKYILTPQVPMAAELDSSYVDKLRDVSGLQFNVKIMSALSTANDISALANKCATDAVWFRKQTDESILIGAGCGDIGEYSHNRSTKLVSVGVREVCTPISTAVDQMNISALKTLLLRHATETTESSTVCYVSILGDASNSCADTSNEPAPAPLCYDPNERPVQYRLDKIDITATTLCGIGGPKFWGYHKTTESTAPVAGRSAEADTKGMKRQASFVTADASSVDPSTVPDYDALGCVWKRDALARLPTPLERAYELDLNNYVELLLDVPRVREVDTLRLYSKTKGGFIPEKLAQMHNLTSLTLCFPWSGHPLTDTIFEVTSLKRLVLTGCKYNLIPETISKLTQLEELNVAGLPLTSLPVIALGTLRNLTSVDCSGIKLPSPPSEIVKQGPAAVARYILALGEGAAENHDVLLMLIGDGEAGKTSMLQALKNLDSNRAGTIGVDDRTVGIDISSFQPVPSKPLRFFAWDFGGQGIYAIMQQLFVSRRALYPLLWRVRQSLDVAHMDASIKCDVCRKRLVVTAGEKQEPVYRVKGQGLCHSHCVSYEPLISSWTERLQFRVPGVTMVLVATHIDCANPTEVDEQCAAVKEVVRRIQERQAQTMQGIPPLKIYGEGESLRVNSVKGEGVAELRRKLVEIAEGLDFYGEVIPATYVRLRQRLRDMQSKDTGAWRSWLLYDEYASIAAECGLQDAVTLQLATRFFHEVGELRYFGLPDLDQGALQEAPPRDVEYDSDGDPIPVRDIPQSVTGRQMDAESSELLSTTVFPNPFWIVDVLRGLIRHDHSTVLHLIKTDTAAEAKDKRTLRRRVFRLMQRGLLHDSLLRYVWHGAAGASTDSSQNADEFSRLIALMKAFDLLMDKPGCTDGAEWIVPALAAGRHSRTVQSEAFIDDSLPFVCRLVYDALPPYFDMILVAHIMNAGIFDTVDFIEGKSGEDDRATASFVMFLVL